MARRRSGSKNKPKNGDKKHGREKRKKTRRGSPISAFVRGRITAAQYFTLIKQQPLQKRG